MESKEKNQILNQMMTEDFNTMREMLSEIEMKIMGVDVLKQKQFIQPLQNIIYEAWADAKNPDDNFLFTKHDNNGK